MPVDPSHNPLFRRAARKLTPDDEIDSRRARGEISCAECRSSNATKNFHAVHVVVRRGCPSICPNGSLSTGQGTRFVLADTTQLHAKISEMGHRIRQLEDALAIFQSGVSNEVHPLLREDLLAIKFGPEKGYVPDKEKTVPKKSPEPPLDAFGTLTIGERGEAKYFGPSAGSETLFLAGAELEQSGSLDDDYYRSTHENSNVDIARLSSLFPFGGECTDFEHQLELLLGNLPVEPRAWSLCETYYEQAAWAFRPIKRDEFIDEILSPIYKSLKDRESAALVSPHKLAVMYLVFALGALVDLTLDPYNKEADTYYQLSRASLSLRSVFDSPEIATVQAVVLMASYHGMAGRRYTMDSSWSLTSLGAKLAQSFGLHRDSAKWNMDAKTVQRRRSLFWELFSAEHFYSLALGRPPSIRLSYVDCELPDDDEATVDADGKVLVGYYRWKYEFTKEVFAPAIEHTLTAEAPQYQTILELDRKVREKTLPAHLNVFMNMDDENLTPSNYMRKCILGQYRSVTLLYLHRSFFAQAMLDHPSNPLKSPYSPSFLAAYRCASGMIKSSLNHYDRFPELCGRWWGIWTHLFSAAIIVGCIVTRSPSSSMAPAAFIELGLACDLFQKGAIHSRRARSGLAIICKMRQKAFQVYSQFRTNNIIPSPLPHHGREYETDELALFGGQTRVLVTKLLRAHKHRKSMPSTSTQNISSPSPSEADSSRSNSSHDHAQDVHPSLVEYLSGLPPSQTHSPESMEQSYNNQEPQPSSSAQSPSNAPQEPPSWTSWTTPSLYTALPPDTYANIASNQGGSSIQYSQEEMSQSQSSGFPSYQQAPPDNANALVDLGMMMSGESGMDEQWMTFMRDSGLLQINPGTMTNYAMPPTELPTYHDISQSRIY
ncbi:hypothetical protein CVT24_008327 [Panaeolus cyanescens]|uniref:Xylanolytic transcriptional activator regulatory domain-containing protein n=1 Tax=Panaeolus cyanescens TaxID=181874 RepID=A0A409VEN9_9AGAR|nr:hypothetical protein CVT24_008327 [Panaeolus cyanescens]